MKKSFMFVAVAAAGMLASCSSDSLTAGPDPKIEPTQEERVPIKINVATPQLTAKGATRGMGTVGDVEGGANNFWQGEKVNVFMFDKGTLDLTLEDGNPLYNNTVLTTPEGVASGIANELITNDTRIVYKYYPASGNYDFWGYFIDDASGAHAEVPAVPYADVDEYNADHDPDITADDFAALTDEQKIKTPAIPAVEAVTIGAEEVTVPFNIDGSQDLMVAKADLTVAQKDNTNPAYAAWHAEGVDHDRYYSAYAARRNIQPDMTFKHLLTRLTFSVYGGDNETCGLEDDGGGNFVLPADGKPYEGVFIKSIKVKSKKTGNIIAAYTGEARSLSQLISFDETGGDANDGYYMLDLKKARNPIASTTPVESLYPAAFNWDDEDGIKAKLTIDQDDSGDNEYWKNIMRPAGTDAGNATPIGGALLVSPEDDYDLVIEIGQCVLVEDSYPAPGTDAEYAVKYYPFPYTITPTKVNDTTQGVSYNVKIKLYGFEKIEIKTTLEPWAPGDEIGFDAE